MLISSNPVNSYLAGLQNEGQEAELHARTDPTLKGQISNFSKTANNIRTVDEFSHSYPVQHLTLDAYGLSGLHSPYIVHKLLTEDPSSNKSLAKSSHNSQWAHLAQDFRAWGENGGNLPTTPFSNHLIHNIDTGANNYSAAVTANTLANFALQAPLIHSASDLIRDPDALRVVTGAFNSPELAYDALTDNGVVNKKSAIYQLLTQPLRDPNSLARTSGNPNWQHLSATFSEWSNQSGQDHMLLSDSHIRHWSAVYLKRSNPVISRLLRSPKQHIASVAYNLPNMNDDQFNHLVTNSRPLSKLNTDAFRNVSEQLITHSGSNIITQTIEDSYTVHQLKHQPSTLVTAAAIMNNLSNNILNASDASALGKLYQQNILADGLSLRNGVNSIRNFNDLIGNNSIVNHILSHYQIESQLSPQQIKKLVSGSSIQGETANEHRLQQDFGRHGLAQIKRLLPTLEHEMLHNTNPHEVSRVIQNANLHSINDLFSPSNKGVLNIVKTAFNLKGNTQDIKATLFNLHKLPHSGDIVSFAHDYNSKNFQNKAVMRYSNTHGGITGLSDVRALANTHINNVYDLLSGAHHSALKVMLGAYGLSSLIGDSTTNGHANPHSRLFKLLTHTASDMNHSERNFVNSLGGWRGHDSHMFTSDFVNQLSGDYQFNSSQDQSVKNARFDVSVRGMHSASQLLNSKYLTNVMNYYGLQPQQDTRDIYQILLTQDPKSQHSLAHISGNHKWQKMANDFRMWGTNNGGTGGSSPFLSKSINSILQSVKDNKKSEADSEALSFNQIAHNHSIHDLLEDPSSRNVILTSYGLDKQFNGNIHALTSLTLPEAQLMGENVASFVNDMSGGMSDKLINKITRNFHVVSNSRAELYAANIQNQFGKITPGHMFHEDVMDTHSLANHPTLVKLLGQNYGFSTSDLTNNWGMIKFNSKGWQNLKHATIPHSFLSPLANKIINNYSHVIHDQIGQIVKDFTNSVTRDPNSFIQSSHLGLMTSVYEQATGVSDISTLVGNARNPDGTTNTNSTLYKLLSQNPNDKDSMAQSSGNPDWKDFAQSFHQGWNVRKMAVDFANSSAGHLTSQINDFTSRIGSVTNAADLLNKPRLVNVISASYGMDNISNEKSLLKILLTQDPSKRNSIANISGVPHWKEFANDMGIWGKNNGQAMTTLFNKPRIDKITNEYERLQYEQDPQNVKDGVGNALYFTRKIGDAKNIYDIMSDSKLLSVIEKVNGLPHDDFGALDFDEQVRILKSKVKLSDFDTPAKRRHYAERYLIDEQMHPDPINKPDNILSLFGGDNDDNNILDLFGGDNSNQDETLALFGIGKMV